MDTIVALVATAHYGFTIAAMSLTLGISVVAAVAAFLRPLERRAIDAVINLNALAILAALLLGAVLLLGRGLDDPLHALYAVVALVAVPLARILAVPAPSTDPLAMAEARVIDRRAARWVFFASLVTLGVLVRLAMTG